MLGADWLLLSVSDSGRAQHRVEVIKPPQIRHPPAAIIYGLLVNRYTTDATYSKVTPQQQERGVWNAASGDMGDSHSKSSVGVCKFLFIYRRFSNLSETKFGKSEIRRHIVRMCFLLHVFNIKFSVVPNLCSAPYPNK